MIEIDVQKKLNAAFGEMLLELKAQINLGQFVAIFGKSGAGKTSTLRILAGLLNPDVGSISINQKVLLDTTQSINLSPQKRKIGFVFQDYALFPNMTILENLSFALQKNQSKKILDELIEIMEIGDLQNQKPHKLSGGQQQRVAVARALVQKPDLLLLDEPLSALDEAMRGKIQNYIKQVHKEFNLTTIMISHDMAEILKMSERVLVLENGKIINDGNPIEIFSEKNNSDKFQITGEIVAINTINLQSIMTILIGKDIATIEIEANLANSFSVGDKLMLSSNQFFPNIKKLN